MALALAVGKANEECAPYRSIGTQVTKSKQEQQEKSSLDYQTKQKIMQKFNILKRSFACLDY